jgi:hypothetical protein
MPVAVPFPSYRLIQFSRLMSFVTMAGIVGIAAAALLVFLIPEWTRDLLLARIGDTNIPLVIDGTTRTLGALVVAVPAAVLMYGLWQARALFDSFARGEVFDESSARRLQAFAMSVFAQALLGPMTVIGLSLAFSIANPPGQRFVAVTLSMQDYMAVIVGGILWAITHAMREATRLSDENASFV